MKNKFLIFWSVLLFCLLIVCAVTMVKIALGSNKRIEPVSSEQSLIEIVTVTTENITIAAETTFESTTTNTKNTTDFCGPTTTTTITTTMTTPETIFSLKNNVTTTCETTISTIPTTCSITKLTTTNLTTQLTTTTIKFTTNSTTTVSSIVNTELENKITPIATLKGTYYLPTRAQQGKVLKGGSGRYLIDCSKGDNQVKGSVASSYFYKRYGYNYNDKRTMLYLEIQEYPEMNGYYYLDDSNVMGVDLIDFFFYEQNSCPFSRRGVVEVNTYIVEY